MRLKEFDLVRGGGYVCQCALNAGALSKRDRSAASEQRDKLSELLQTNSSSALEQLVLELADERWSDKVFVSQKLAQQQQHQQHFNRSTDKSARRLHKWQLQQQQPAPAPISLSHFLLGGQLDADAHLAWFVDGGDAKLGAAEWPAQSCQCNDTDTAMGSVNATRPLCAIRVFDAETVSGLMIVSGAAWFRPLVVSLQSFCMLVTLALIGLLFRVRKSRVSSST